MIFKYAVVVRPLHYALIIYVLERYNWNPRG